ncbi:MAG: ABC transporter ATP-binding protein [Myxococcota bacterium]
MKAAISVAGLKKSFQVGVFPRRMVEALRGIDLEVRSGEVFGFLGPNGAGKTTTIKILTDLIRPTSGSAAIFGLQPGDPEARRRIGFVPENPSFYDHLTGAEHLSYFGSLNGVPSKLRRERVATLLERVGLSQAGGLQVRRYSKGMAQRLAIAQALMGDPALLILDEPTSGLDPVGRREVHDIVLDLRRQGCTVFFSTHIIPDVEQLCDRVTILVGGRIVKTGTVDELLASDASAIELVARGVPEGLLKAPPTPLTTPSLRGERATFVVNREEDIDQAVVLLRNAGAKLLSINPRRYSLEDFFLKEAKSTPAIEGTRT